MTEEIKEDNKFETEGSKGHRAYMALKAIRVAKTLEDLSDLETEAKSTGRVPEMFKLALDKRLEDLMT